VTNASGTSSRSVRAGPAWLWSDEPIQDPLGRADKAVRFVRKLRLHEGRFAGKPFPLADWQERLIRRIYGPVDELGRRQVRTAFIMVPRGSGKSSLAAALGLLYPPCRPPALIAARPSPKCTSATRIIFAARSTASFIGTSCDGICAGRKPTDIAMRIDPTDPAILPLIEVINSCTSLIGII
jgi:hypothetical protein